MAFALKWIKEACEAFQALEATAAASLQNRKKSKKEKSSKAEGLFKQVQKCIRLLTENPRHPGLQTHEFYSSENPFDKNEKVFEAYIQNNTPGAYRLFWCYGPENGEITILDIAAHP